MATILSTELLHFISPILVFIFIFAVLYAVLQRFEAFGKNQPVSAAISGIGALLFVIVPVMRDFVQELVPSLVILFLVIVVILVMLMFLGYKEKDLLEYMQENSYGVIVVTVVILVFLFALGKAIGPVFTQYPGPLEAGLVADLKRIIFNPKFLGAFLILVIAGYLMKTIAFPVKVMKD